MLRLVAENITTAVVADAGHFLMEEQLKAVAQLVLNAVKKVG